MLDPQALVFPHPYIFVQWECTDFFNSSQYIYSFILILVLYERILASRLSFLGLIRFNIAVIVMPEIYIGCNRELSINQGKCIYWINELTQVLSESIHRST